MSLCLYSMIAFYRDDKLAVESAMKYFRPRRFGIEYPAIRHVPAIRTDRLPRTRCNQLSSNRYGPGASSAGACAFLGCGICRSCPRVQDRGRAISYVGTRCLSWFAADFHHCFYRCCTKNCCVCPGHAPPGRWPGRLCMGMWQQMLIILALLSVGSWQYYRYSPGQSETHAGVFNHFPHGIFPVRYFKRAPRPVTVLRLFYVLVYTTMSCAAFGLISVLVRQGF